MARPGSRFAAAWRLSRAPRCRSNSLYWRWTMGGDYVRRVTGGGRIARLRSASQGFAKLRAEPYMEACEHELEHCGVAAHLHTPHAAHGLTRAELAVAQLVAAGKSNRRTAEELFVTVKTVEFHLRVVFAKLGITSRQQIAEVLANIAGSVAAKHSPPSA